MGFKSKEREGRGRQKKIHEKLVVDTLVPHDDVVRSCMVGCSLLSFLFPPKFQGSRNGDDRRSGEVNVCVILHIFISTWSNFLPN